MSASQNTLERMTPKSGVRRVFLDDANVSRGPLAVSTRGYLTRLLAVRWTVASSGRLTELRTQPVRCANAISVSRHNTDRSGDTYNNIAEHIGAPIKTNRSKKVLRFLLPIECTETPFY
jgi:hypothetical protein